MFCSNCGIQLIPGASFCSGCGSRITAPQAPVNPPPSYTPPQPVYQPASGTEETVLLLKATHKLSFANAVVCHVVFRRNWLVLAHLTQQLQKAESARLLDSLKAQNLNIIKRGTETGRFWYEFHKRYLSMATDAILAEDPSNLVIRYDAITYIEYKCAEDTTDSDNSYSLKNGSLQISLTNGEKLKLSHQERHTKKMQESLTALFGPRLKYKK